MAKKQAILVLALTFLLLITLTSCNFGQLQNLTSKEASHGVQHGGLTLPEACEQVYGFLPCTKSAIGNVFLVFVYGYLVLVAAKWLTKGSEILLEINGYGVFGGLFLPLLCSLPGALIILASGLFGSKETAQTQASISMGLLAGSTITLLTLLWGSSVLAGNCDLQNPSASDSPNTRGLSLTGSGVMTDTTTSHTVWIMLISIVPFISVLMLQLFLSSHSHLGILISLVVSVSLLLSYCLYQIFEPWIQHRRLAYAKYKHVKSVMLWVTETGEPNRDSIIKLFETIDHNSDGYLSATELRALVFGLNFEEIDSDIDDIVKNLLSYFDTSGDNLVDVNEFIEGISRWIKEVLPLTPSVVSHHDHDHDQDHQKSQSSQGTRLRQTFLRVFLMQGISNWIKEIMNGGSHHNQDHQQTQSPPTARFKYNPLPKEHRMHLLFDEKVESSEESKRHGFIAILTLLLGTGIAAAFAVPLVDAVNNLSSAITVPPFFVAFVILPFICSSEIVPALVLASRKKQRLASLIFSEIYREATMSNMIYLSSFLVVVYFRQLTWNFSSEIIIVLLVCIFMGVFAGLRTTFPLWTCLVAFMLYPLSLALIYALHFSLGSS